MIYVYNMWDSMPDSATQGCKSWLFQTLLWFVILLSYLSRSVFPVSGFADKSKPRYTHKHTHAHPQI